jgi:hypothetical protein
MMLIALDILLYLMPCFPMSRGVDNTKCRQMRELRMCTNSRSLHECFYLCFYIKKYDVYRYVWFFRMYPSERNGAANVTIVRHASFSTFTSRG